MKIKRSGFVYSIYKQNIIALWVVAAVLMAGLVYMLIGSGNYLMNYLFYRSEPDEALLTEYVTRDMLDYDTVMADIEAHGGEMALIRQCSTMFYKDNVYQEGGRYRFSLELTGENLTDTGIYYDEMATAYTGITDRAQLKELVSREHYIKEHLYFYDYHGIQLLLALDYDKELRGEHLGSQRVTFAPIGVYSLYMVYDLVGAGYTGGISNYLVDVRDTPIDYEDEDFKDFCMFSPFAIVFFVVALVLTIMPQWHPTYRQLQKYGRTIEKAVEKVEANYAEFGSETVDRKTMYLEDWIIKKSLFKTSIERDYRKQHK
ncbi:MAG: hypothetical protein PUC06_11745 [Oscillospiraceae bacterium]|nr:hypothetical protein [Oscillospiraceae bacterium]